MTPLKFNFVLKSTYETPICLNGLSAQFSKESMCPFLLAKKLKILLEDFVLKLWLKIWSGLSLTF